MVRGVLPPVGRPTSGIVHLVLFSVVIPFVFVGSGGPSFRVYFVCGCSSQDVAGGCGVVSTFIQDVRTSERCIHAYSS